MVKIGIIGSRRRDTETDLVILAEFLMDFLEIYKDKEIVFVSGGCPQGGDRFAEILAKEWNIPIIIHYPDKSKLPENAKRWDYAKINYDRNTLIAKDSDELITLVAPDRKGGTEDTIKKFIKMKNKNPIILG